MALLRKVTTLPASDENTRSYLSVKRASLKKRLRLKTISSKSEAEDSTTTGKNVYFCQFTNKNGKNPH